MGSPTGTPPNGRAFRAWSDGTELSKSAPTSPTHPSPSPTHPSQSPTQPSPRVLQASVKPQKRVEGNIIDYPSDGRTDGVKKKVDVVPSIAVDYVDVAALSKTQVPQNFDKRPLSADVKGDPMSLEYRRSLKDQMKDQLKEERRPRSLSWTIDARPAKKRTNEQ